MSLWPIVEFLASFGLGVGLGSWDLIRAKAGIPTQTKSRRSAVILQSLGIIMLILVGSTTYEQHRDSEQHQRDAEQYKRDADCQTVRNQEFSDGIRARAIAQSVFTDADIAFTDADEAWVAEQIRMVDAVRGHTLTKAEQDQLLDQWRVSLVAKLVSAQAKQRALRDLDLARDANPIDSPRNC